MTRRNSVGNARNGTNSLQWPRHSLMIAGYRSPWHLRRSPAPRPPQPHPGPCRSAAGPWPAVPSICGRHTAERPGSGAPRSCTTACGQVTPIASGRPVSPSQHTMHTSATPRPLSSDKTVSQNLADSPVVGPTHRPSTCLAPWQSIPDRQVDGPVGDHPVPDLILTMRASMKITG